MEKLVKVITDRLIKSVLLATADVFDVSTFCFLHLDVLFNGIVVLGSRHSFILIVFDRTCDVELDALGESLLLKTMLHLRNNLLLEKLLLKLFDLERLWLLGWSASLVPLVDHLEAEAFDWDLKVEPASR